MPPLTAIERFFERLFERPSARLFRARLQPIQLQRRIERAMEGERLTTSDRTLVPNRFVVHLHPTDLAEFGDMTGTLASELADGALAFARAHHYTRRRSAARRPAGRSGHRARRHPGRRPVRRGRSPDARRAGSPAPARPTGDDPDRRGRADEHAGLRGPPTDAPRAPSCSVTDPDGGTRAGRHRGRQPDDRAGDRQRPASSTTGGSRAITDGSAGAAGRWSTRTSGSTNGSRVNGVPVTEVVLGVGDRLEVGDTALVVEVAGAPD